MFASWNSTYDRLAMYVMNCIDHGIELKGSSDQSHFIFENNVGKKRIRHRTTLNLNDPTPNRFWVDLEIEFQSRSMSDPTFSDIEVFIINTLTNSKIHARLRGYSIHYLNLQ